MTAQQISDKSIRQGKADIIRKFGSTIAKSRFNIASDRHVPSPSERLDLAVQRGVNRAMKSFQTASNPSTPKAATKTKGSTVKAFAARGPNWSVKRFSVPFSR
jgi:hypothetical protein